jgi:hypothetical protein
MILKRQEKDGIVKAMYDSSNIVASVYNNNTNDLEIIFKAGTRYKYPNVSKSDYMRFEIAESQGAVFNTHIKKYSFEKIGNVDVSQLLTETSELKQQEDKALLEGKKAELLVKLKYVVQIENTDLFVNALTTLKKDIDSYLSETTKN